MKMLLMVLLVLTTLTGCDKLTGEKDYAQQREDQHTDAAIIYWKCINHNLAMKDYSARSKQHCVDLRREAASQ
jgi:hypothetical protein